MTPEQPKMRPLDAPRRVPGGWPITRHERDVEVFWPSGWRAGRHRGYRREVYWTLDGFPDEFDRLADAKQERRRQLDERVS